MTAANKETLKLPNDAPHIRAASQKILDAARTRMRDQAKLFDVKLSVEEAIRNAMVHGNRNEAGRFVTVSWWVDADTLTIEVEDEGRGFDPGKVPDPTGKEGLLRQSGRGVYLMKRLMDKVIYNTAGNKVTMFMKLR